MLYFRNIWSVTLIVLATTLLANAAQEESRKGGSSRNWNHSKDHSLKEGGSKSSSKHSKHSTNHHLDISDSTYRSMDTHKHKHRSHGMSSTESSLMDTHKSKHRSHGMSSTESSWMDTHNPKHRSSKESDMMTSMMSSWKSCTLKGRSSKGRWESSWKGWQPPTNVNLGPDPELSRIPLPAQQLIHAVLFDVVDVNDITFKKLVETHMNNADFIQFFVGKTTNAGDEDKEMITSKLQEKKILEAFRDNPNMPAVLDALRLTGAGGTRPKGGYSLKKLVQCFLGGFLGVGAGGIAQGMATGGGGSSPAMGSAGSMVRSGSFPATGSAGSMVRTGSFSAFGHPNSMGSRVPPSSIGHSSSIGGKGSFAPSAYPPSIGGRGSRGSFAPSAYPPSIGGRGGRGSSPSSAHPSGGDYRDHMESHCRPYY